MPRQSKADSATLVSSTIRTRRTDSTVGSHRLYLGLDFFLGQSWPTSRFQRRRKSQESVERLKAPPLAGDEIDKIFHFRELFRRERLDFVDQGLLVRRHDNGARLFLNYIQLGRRCIPVPASATSGQLKLLGAERIALARIAAFQADAEPAHALGARAVGEAVRHDAPL